MRGEVFKIYCNFAVFTKTTKKGKKYVFYTPKLVTLLISIKDKIFQIFKIRTTFTARAIETRSKSF